MGSGASTPAPATAEAKTFNGSKGNTTKETELFAQSPFDDTGPLGSPFGDDDKGEESGQKAVASATKLKRMAFGQQTYMDQQRDYDQTLNKLELNKSGIIDWNGPMGADKSSPQRTPKGAAAAAAKGNRFPDSSFMSPGEAKSATSTPDARAGAVARKPPPPSAAPSPVPRTVGSTGGAGVLSPTQQVVQAPNHPPSRVPPQSQPHPRHAQPTAPGGQEALHGQGYGHSASFTAPQPAMHAKRGIQQHPEHNSSGTQLAPHHHNHLAGPPHPHPHHPGPATSGPPPGLISRPFPQAQLESHPSDVDDGMIADFTKSTKVVDTKRPDNIPPLKIGSSSGNDLSNRIAPVRNNPQLGPALGVHGQGRPAGPSPVPLHLQAQMRPATVGSSSQSGPRMPGMHPSPGNPTSGAPSPMFQTSAAGGRPMGGPTQPAPPGTAGGTASRPAPAPVPHGTGGAHLNAPVVKETKNVKRNRAQLPTQLAHALPTTGDWMNKRYIVNNYILLDVLGTGSYGEVRMCKDRTTDKLYAIKILNKDFLKKKKTGKTDETFFEDIKREIAIMKKLLHPNVLRLFEVLDDPKVNKMYLVLEYMKMGDLINVLKARGAETDGTAPANGQGEGAFTPLSDLEVWNIFRQVVSGIRYLHYQNVVHGDIKPQNLLLGEDGIVKIADFGISQMLSASGQKLADAAGTPAFMSPELCEGKSFSGQLADVWAIGATMFMLRFGHPPFLAKSIINLYNKICNDPLVFPGPIDPGLQNLLENLLEKDPNKRYTLQQIIMHPWFRHPPSAQAGLQHPRAGPATPHHGAHAGAMGSAGHNHHGAALGLKAAMSSNHSFMPPDSYAAEEEAAMKVPVKIEHNDEVFMSIGGIQKRDKVSPKRSAAGSIDEEGKHSGEFHSESEGEEADAGAQAIGGDDGDMMNTDWGADVFQMVEDGNDSDNNVDDDSVDEDSDKEDDAAASKSKQSGGSGSDGKEGGLSGQRYGSEGSMFATRTEMTEEEVAKRARRFIAKATRKSQEDMPPTSSSAASSQQQVANESGSSRASASGGIGVGSGSPSKGVGVGRAESPSEASSSAATPKVNKLPFKAVSSRFGPRTRGDSIRASTASRDDDGGEDADEVSMEDFSRIMDTLAMQPRRHSDRAEEDVQSVKTGLLPIDGFSAELINKKNGIAAAFNSEKGARHSQEDRCVLCPNAAQMKGLDTSRLDAARLEALHNFTVACIFDGHSGWRCAQYLCQHFAPTLVMHERFLDKTCEAALMDVCATLDAKVCDMLMDEEDSSGSTGVVAVYDGRRHVLSVAGVGDSMCVLSRAGKAVILNRMHRLDNEDERERVKRAGGTIVNNRVNGLLAISRAFGDTQFKPEKDDSNSTRSPDGLVISTPEVFCEVITPMTEFAVMATDGLWDVMSAQMAVAFVRNMLHKHRDLEEAARGLTKEAIARGSVDNVTVLIMSFHYSDEGKIKSAKHSA